VHWQRLLEWQGHSGSQSWVVDLSQPGSSVVEEGIPAGVPVEEGIPEGDLAVGNLEEDNPVGEDIPAEAGIPAEGGIPVGEDIPVEVGIPDQDNWEEWGSLVGEDNPEDWAQGREAPEVGMTCPSPLGIAHPLQGTEEGVQGFPLPWGDWDQRHSTSGEPLRS